MFTPYDVEEIQVEATSYCNARCPQCDRFDSKNNVIVPLKHIPLETIKKINKKTLPNLRRIVFEGNNGDILNHPRALDIAQYLTDIEEVVFVTNASIRTPEYFKKLAEVKNLKIVFSIDGLEDTNHLYRQNTNFGKIIKNAQAFIENGGYAYWKFIVFQHNQHQIDDARQLSIELGFKEFEARHTDRSWSTGDEWIVYCNGEIQKHTLKPSTLVLEQSIRNETGLGNPAKTYKNLSLPIECSAFKKRELFIEFNGNVIPCCMLSQDFWNHTQNSKFLKRLIGDSNINLNDRSLEEIFSSEFYTKVLPDSLASRPMPKCIHFCGNPKSN